MSNPLLYYVFNPASYIARSIVSCLKSSFPGKSQWDVDKMPDLQDDVAIVTGGNTGIGKETCRVRIAPSHSVGSPAFITNTYFWRVGTFEKERQGLPCCQG